jgi:hypothetical protein
VSDTEDRIDSLDRLLKKLREVNSAKSSSGETTTATVDGARAFGGPVIGGNTYLVGEKGPELFTPSTGGRITPNKDLAANMMTVVFPFPDGSQGELVATQESAYDFYEKSERAKRRMS